MVSVQLHNILMHVFHVFLYITLILGTYAFILDKIRVDNYQTENYQDQQPVAQGMYVRTVARPIPPGQTSKVDEVEADIKKIEKILKKFKTNCKTNCNKEKTEIGRLKYQITSKNLGLKPLREENRGLREENKGLREENKELKKRPVSCPAQGQSAQGQPAQGPVMEFVSQGDGYDSSTHLKIDSTKCKNIFDNFTTTFTKTWYPTSTIQTYQTLLPHGCIMRSNPQQQTFEMGYNSYGNSYPNYVTCGANNFKCVKQKK